ncbi:MAG TPA: cytochrome c [Devosia sp.]|nr:cytochrome c [Devosia sp.]
MKRAFKASAGLVGAAALLATFSGILPSSISAQSETRGSGEQAGNTGSSALQDRSSHSPQEALYVEKCSMCHRQMGMGTMLLARRVEKGKEMLESRDDLTVEYVKYVARNGLDNMPRIPRGEVSDEQLDIIAHYLAKAKSE